MPCGRSSHMLSGVFPLPSSHLVEMSSGGKEKKPGFIWEKRWSSITFGYKYASSFTKKRSHHRITVIANIVALEEWRKGGEGHGSITQEEQRRRDRKWWWWRGAGLGLGGDHNHEDGTLMLPRLPRGKRGCGFDSLFIPNTLKYFATLSVKKKKSCFSQVPQCWIEDGQHVCCWFARVTPKHDVIHGGAGTAHLVANECRSHCEQRSCVHPDASFSLYNDKNQY